MRLGGVDEIRLESFNWIAQDNDNFHSESYALETGSKS